MNIVGWIRDFKYVVLDCMDYGHHFFCKEYLREARGSFSSFLFSACKHVESYNVLVSGY